jgi:hypothetical protein
VSSAPVQGGLLGGTPGGDLAHDPAVDSVGERVEYASALRRTLRGSGRAEAGDRQGQTPDETRPACPILRVKEKTA